MSSFLSAAPEQGKPKQARDRNEESTRLMVVIGSIGVDAALPDRLLVSAGHAVRVRCFGLRGKEFANVIQFIS